MTRCLHIILFTLLLGCFFACSDALAAGKEGRVVWSKKPGHRSGLYTQKNDFVAQGLGISVNALYYFGDADNEGMAFNGGFNLENLSLGMGLNVAYQLPLSNHFNMRFGLCGGMLRANNKEKFDQLKIPRDDYRSFRSIFLQPVVNVQYYPFSKAGFYITAGVGFAVSFITKYQFYFYDKVEGTSTRVRGVLEGDTYGFLPMVQGGIGYSWRLADNWSMSAELMIEYGIVDLHYMNLDAYPLAQSQNSSELAKGSTSGQWIGRGGSLNSRWNDGWFQFGLTVTYQWRTCEHCRLINNYRHIRPKRR